MKKTFFLAYGVLVYMLSIGTFLYAIGFVSSLAVSNSLDSEPKEPLVYALITNISLLALFAFQQSLMIRPAFKKLWRRYIPGPIERSTYVLLSCLCLIILFTQWQPIGGTIWNIESEVGIYFLLLISMFGFWISVISTFLINHFDFLGMRQVWYFYLEKKYSPLPFRTPLYYKYVRHPLYFGITVALLFTPAMTVDHVLFALSVIFYLLISIYFEERALIDRFGEKYSDYKRTVPMLIPFIKRIRDNDRSDENLFTHI
jgi:protein-S-isoprenylcysteine O-methyltransferase Ste14